ncbi:phosphohistidine phosphatase SixA [Aliivibrio kagoshimensis]|uniref:phosphohistidine phosphatase SixA n=1 Tax=Aliivibrio kagoshimensis TaxID=2910230 RepID=UPI003D0D10C6
MQVLIMRHGEAENFAPSDAERELTVKGELQSLNMAKWLSNQLSGKIDYVLVSPYLRAQQTWNAVKNQLDVDPQCVEVCNDITPYGQSDLVIEYINALAAMKSLQTVLVISHLPLVGYMTADWVTDLVPPMFTTSSIAAVDVNLETSKGELCWMQSPNKL